MEISKVHFENWCESKGSSIVAPRFWNYASCPIANFLIDCYSGKVRIYVFVFDKCVSFGDKSTPLPDWAINFIDRIDVSPQRKTGITGQECLEYLKDIE